MKVYMLKTPSGQVPVGIFSEYEKATDLAQSMFRLCSVTEAQCVEEFELDPLKELTEVGIYPWLVNINVTNQDTELGTLNELFKEEHIVYTQGKLAKAYVYGPNEEEAENRALELWADYQDTEDSIKAISIFTVRMDENGDVSDVRKMVAYSQHPDIKNQVKTHSNSVEARVLADTIDEAIATARELYDKWIDDQLEFMDDSNALIESVLVEKA
jgi:hypothetical protein